MLTLKEGAVVQITDPSHHWFPCLLIVDEVRPWGIQGYAVVPISNAKPQSTSQAFIRLETAQFKYIGEAKVTTGEEENTDDSE